MDPDISEWDVQKLKDMGLDTQPAQASRLPSHSGDGYYYGGGSIVVIGKFAIQIGEGEAAWPLAQELARRWNAEI